IALSGCSLGYLPVQGNYRTSDSAVFEDFEEYEKKLDIKFSIGEVSKEKYAKNIENGEEIIENLEIEDESYFNGDVKDIKIMPIKETSDKIPEEYYFDYGEFPNHTIHTTFTEYQNHYDYKLVKPKNWNEVNDQREKNAPVYYIKGIDKIKTLRYDRNRENIELGHYDGSEILIQGIKDGKIIIMVAVKYYLEEIPSNENYPPRARRIKIYELTLDLYEDKVEMSPYWEYTWNEYKEKEHKKYYYE
ncbi:MAG: hypothetical protein ACOCUI_02615, partial [bacterium]